MIEIENLTKVFPSHTGTVCALDDVSLRIEDGEIFGIIGLSGAGKSTLVRCINLLERPTSGSVRIDGEDITTLRRRDLLCLRRNIGMIFQGFHLLEQRNVIENVCFPLRLARMPREQAYKRAEELLTLVGLSDKSQAYPATLSGGQKQRVAIARALASEPRYLLCDEATSALDPNTTASILDLLQTINRTMGVTIVIITHEMDVIERVCDRVAVLDQSRIVECGRVADVFTKPSSEIARELILSKMPRSARAAVRIRTVFNGESSYEPLISQMVMACGVSVNILFADMKRIDARAFGQMLLEIALENLPRIEAWLTEHAIPFTVEP